MTDELFTPTIKSPPVPSTPPWRPDSIVYPAFFGGPLAGTVLGLINGRRLALGRSGLVLIAAVGVACFAARIVFTATVGDSTSPRFAGAVAGVLTWLVIIWLQKRPFRQFTHHDREPASLIGPGLAAAIGCGVLEAAVIVAVTA